MTQRWFAQIVVLGSFAVIAACSSDDEGVFAAGATGSGGDSATSSSTGSGGNATSSSTGSGPVSCDNDVKDCAACQGCAFDVGGPCRTFSDACFTNDECTAINTCLGACIDKAGGSPKCDTACEADCRDDCKKDHPDGVDAFEGAFDCINEDACVNACTF